MTYPEQDAEKLLNKIASGYALDDLLYAYEDRNLNEIISITRAPGNNCNLRPIESYYREQEIFNGFMCDLSKLCDENNLNEDTIPQALYKLNLYKSTGGFNIDEIAKLLIIFLEEINILYDEIDILDETTEDVPKFISKCLNAYLGLLKKWAPIIYELEKEEYRVKINHFISDKYSYTPEDMKAIEEIFNTPRFRNIYDEECNEVELEKNGVVTRDKYFIFRNGFDDIKEKLTENIITYLSEKPSNRRKAVVMEALISMKLYYDTDLESVESANITKLYNDLCTFVNSNSELKFTLDWKGEDKSRGFRTEISKKKKGASEDPNILKSRVRLYEGELALFKQQLEKLMSEKSSEVQK